jgi:hypothetical protein
MNSNDHIEDLFRDKLGGLEKKPSSNGWDMLQPTLNNLRLEHLAKLKLANQMVTPAKSVWHRIVTKLWFDQFIHFSALKFNIYYAVVGLVGVTTGIVSITNQKALEYQPEKLLNTELLAAQETYQLIDATEMQLMPSINSQLTINNDDEDFKLEERKLNQNQILLKEDMLTISEDDTEILSENIQEQNDAENNNFDESVIKQQEVNSNPQSYAFINEVEGSIISEQNQFDIFKMPLSIEHLVPLANVNIIQSIIYNERPDTLGLDYRGEPIVKKLNYFEQGWYSGLLFLNQEFLYQNPEMQELNNSDGKSQSHLSYQFGLRFNYVRKNLILQSGLYYANLNNQFEHKETHVIIQDNTPHTAFNQYEWPYQTDTILSVKERTYHNTYSYVELPLLIGTQLETNKMAINIKGGPVLSLMTNVNGAAVLSSDNRISRLGLDKFRQPSVSFVFSTDLIYRLNDNLSIYIEPAYKYGLNSIFEKQYQVNSRFNGFSVGLGMYYRF